MNVNKVSDTNNSNCARTDKLLTLKIILPNKHLVTLGKLTFHCFYKYVQVQDLHLVLKSTVCSGRINKTK